MNHACGCSRETKVLMEIPETVSLTEFHPRYANKSKKNLLVNPLDGWMCESTIKLRIADQKNLLYLFDSTTKLARTGSEQGTNSGVLNR